MTETETEIPDSVFRVAIRRTGPRAAETRGLLGLLDHFLPHQQPDESLRQVNGEFIGGAEARTALRVLASILGPTHGAVVQAANDLREELRR
jgi:hypothetical protein